ncbi:MAG: hypothetical protein ACRDN0_12825 [Trebonia sp.]
MASMRIVPMTLAHAEDIATWRYPPPYDCYDMTGAAPEFFADPANRFFAVVSADDADSAGEGILLGFRSSEMGRDGEPEWDGEAGGAPRYRMSGTIREYAGQRLTEAAESELARHAHLAYFTELAETAEPHLRRAEQLEWLATLAAEHDNIGSAMRGALAAAAVPGEVTDEIRAMVYALAVLYGDDVAG